MIVALVLWGVANTGQPPSDAELLQNFARHRSTFDELARMASADSGLLRVDDNWTLPQNPLSAGVSYERVSKYRAMLRSVGVPRGFQSREGGQQIDFLFWLMGSALSSDTTKGYSYLQKAPRGLLDNLDDCGPINEQRGVRAYRQIEGNWYLFYEYLPG